METQTNSLLYSSKNFHPVTIFGYSSKSFPGLEIHGLGRYGKILKEKIIYLTKSRRLQVPLKKYVIVIEELSEEVETLKWIDLPVLLIYWQLAQIIAIKKLNNCFSLGYISPGGEITIPLHQYLLSYVRSQDYVLISSLSFEENLATINLKDLFHGISHLKWKESQLDLQSLSWKDHSSLNNLIGPQDKLHPFAPPSL